MTYRALTISAIFRSPRWVFATLCLSIGLTPTAGAITDTTTQLSVPMPTVAVGVPTLLVATVTDASNHPVLQGTVVFYDRERILGSAQIVSRAGGKFTQGTANLKTGSFNPGANSITAVFAGTKTDAGSTSAATTLTVTGGSLTSVSLTSAAVAGHNTLTATLTAFGPVTAVPTGPSASSTSPPIARLPAIPWMKPRGRTGSPFAAANRRIARAFLARLQVTSTAMATSTSWGFVKVT